MKKDLEPLVKELHQQVLDAQVLEQRVKDLEDQLRALLLQLQRRGLL